MAADRIWHCKGIVVDTNMFLVPYQFGVDIFYEFERLMPGLKIYTIPQVVKEVERLLYKGSLEERLAAKIAARLLKKVEILKVDPEVPTDRILLKLSNDYVIATNDRELRRKIRKKGGNTIFLRERNHLELE